MFRLFFHYFFTWPLQLYFLLVFLPIFSLSWWLLNVGECVRQRTVSYWIWPSQIWLLRWSVYHRQLIITMTNVGCLENFFVDLFLLSKVERKFCLSFHPYDSKHLNKMRDCPQGDDDGSKQHYLPTRKRLSWGSDQFDFVSWIKRQEHVLTFPLFYELLKFSKTRVFSFVIFLINFLYRYFSGCFYIYTNGR